MHRVTPSLWPPSFEVAIFDFDGTIAATGHIWKQVDEIFLGSHGIEYTEEYARTLSVLGFERGARYTIDLYGLQETEEEVVAEWTRLSQALYRTTVDLRPGARAYIHVLREHGIACALATSNEPNLIEGMRNVHVSELFDTCVYGREMSTSKDEPDIYLEAARRLGSEPERCMVFEDIAPGLSAARRAGFQTCACMADDFSQDWETVKTLGDLTLHSWMGLAATDPAP